MLELLAQADRALLEATHALRWEPVTGFFVIVSAWWAKGLVFTAAAAAADVITRRRWPVGLVAVLLAVGLTTVLTNLAKRVFDRARPPQADPDLVALVPLPSSASFPSGHASMAFAGACALALVYPRLRWPALALAATVGFSRLYLGVHFWFDVLAGAGLGALIGAGVAAALRRGEPPPAPPGPPRRRGRRRNRRPAAPTPLAHPNPDSGYPIRAGRKLRDAKGGRHVSQSSDEIRREIEQTRQELGETIEEIADRANPKRIAERGKGRARERARALRDEARPRAEEVVRRAQDAPFAAGFIATGGALLILRFLRRHPRLVLLTAGGAALLAKRSAGPDAEADGPVVVATPAPAPASPPAGAHRAEEGVA